jgi:hypothetical protein
MSLDNEKSQEEWTDDNKGELAEGIEAGDESVVCPWLLWDLQRHDYVHSHSRG